MAGSALKAVRAGGDRSDFAMISGGDRGLPGNAVGQCDQTASRDEERRRVLQSLVGDTPQIESASRLGQPDQLGRGAYWSG